MNKFKQWYYGLTEKQVNKMVIVAIAIGYLFSFIFFLVTYLLGAFPREHTHFVCFCISLGLPPLIIGLTIHSLLWLCPFKQAYIFCKEFDDDLSARVRNRFGLTSQFKEVFYVPLETTQDFIGFPNSPDSRYFAKEIDNIIFLSIRNQKGNEILAPKIVNYLFFDLNFKPKE